MNARKSRARRRAPARVRLDCPGGPYFGELMGSLALWHREAKGGTVLLMPAPEPSWPQETQAAYGARVIAHFTQRCPACGSEDVTIVPTAPRFASGTLSHEFGCPAADDSLFLGGAA
jgi:hypothetical protein